jgi:hypothetical protein
MKVEKPRDEPVLLVKWYEYTKWVLDRVDGFPKNQRFVLGTRLADAVVLVVELLAEVAYAGGGRKKELLSEVNRKIEVTRWLVRLAADRNLISNRQFVHSCRSLEECGAWWAAGASLWHRPGRRHPRNQVVAKRRRPASPDAAKFSVAKGEISAQPRGADRPAMVCGRRIIRRR